MLGLVPWKLAALYFVNVYYENQLFMYANSLGSVGLFLWAYFLYFLYQGGDI